MALQCRIGIQLVLRDGKHNLIERAVDDLLALADRYALEVVVVFDGTVRAHQVEEAVSLTEKFLAPLVQNQVVTDSSGCGRSQLRCTAADGVQIIGGSFLVAVVQSGFGSLRNHGPLQFH